MYTVYSQGSFFRIFFVLWCGMRSVQGDQHCCSNNNCYSIYKSIYSVLCPTNTVKYLYSTAATELLA